MNINLFRICFISYNIFAELTVPLWFSIPRERFIALKNPPHLVRKVMDFIMSFLILSPFAGFEVFSFSNACSGEWVDCGDWHTQVCVNEIKVCKPNILYLYHNERKDIRGNIAGTRGNFSRAQAIFHTFYICVWHNCKSTGPPPTPLWIWDFLVGQQQPWSRVLCYKQRPEAQLFQLTVTISWHLICRFIVFGI